MKKTSSFVQNKNIIWTYFKINKKLIIFFLILWTVIVAGGLVLTTIGLGETVIANYTHETSTRYENGGTSSSGGGVALTLLYSVLFNTVGVLFYGLIAIIFINKIIIKEVSTTQISLWLTQPISRTQLILSKLSFIILLVTLMYIPSFIMLVSFSAQAFDANELFVNVLLIGIQYYIYIVMIAVLIFIFSLLVIENGTLFNIISSLLLVYLTVNGVLGLLIFEMNIPKLDKVAFIPRYLGPQIFLTNLLETNWDAEPIVHILKQEIVHDSRGEGLYTEMITISPVRKENYFRFISLDISMVLVTGIMVWYSNVMFNEKSFNI